MNRGEKFWEAVLNRDQRFDGRFVYAVRSTGIYCRPTCPSRRPNRRQVIFFHEVVAAEKAGFRPCRRCQPREPIGMASKLVRLACGYIQENHTEPIRLADLSRRFNVSPGHLHRSFKRVLGVSPAQYAHACRMKTIKGHLQGGKDVTTAMYESGFGSSSRLYERAQSNMGMTPGIYGKGGQGMHIAYATAACPLGRVLVAATKRGLCAVTFGNSDQELKAALEAEYPKAGIIEDRRMLNSTLKIVLEHLDGQQPRLDFPLDVCATAFQIRVWEELCRIPYGKTRSYSDVAKIMGKPKSVRAVARACATNPVSLVIPCHRVLGKTGQLTGYRWGKKRKAALLAQEQKRKRQ